MKRKRLKIKNRLRFAIVVLLFVLVIGIGGGALAVYLGGEDAAPQLEKGLVGHWKFDGTAEDATPNSNDGTLNGDAAVTANDRKGQSNLALALDGVGDYVDVANETNFDFERTDPFSVSAWIRVDSSSTRQDIVGKQLASGGFPGWNFRISQTASDSKLFILLQNDGTGNNKIAVRATSDTVPSTTWTHVVLSYDGSSNASGVSVYRDGGSVALTIESDTLTASMLNDVSVDIGATGEGTLPFNGLIDDVRIYNRALSAVEVIALFDSYNPGVTTGSLLKDLVGHWKFDDAADLTAQDSTPNSNDGTLNGTGGGPDASSDRKSQSNKAYSFVSANSDYISLGNPAELQITVNITLSVWIKSNDQSEKKRIINKLNSGTGQQSYTLFTETDGTVTFKFWIGDAGKNVSSTTDIVDNNWHHISATYDGSSIRMYIDGVLEATTGSITGSIDNDSSNVDIGRKADNIQYFNGNIDDVRIYNRALSIAEVTQLYDSYNPGIVLNRGVMDILGSTGTIIPMINSEFPSTSSTFETRGSASAKTFTWGTDASPSLFDTLPSKLNGNDVVTFNGTDEEADTPDATYWSRGDGTNDSPFSIGAWVNVTDTAAARVIFSKFDSTTGSELREWVFMINNDDILRLGLFDESANVATRRNSDAAITMGSYRFFVATYDGAGGSTAADTITLYDNGSVLASSAVNNASYEAMENLSSVPLLGANTGPSAVTNFFQSSIAAGEIGPFFVQKELTAAEVTELYNYGRRKLGQ